jgi:hypothetical protein
MISAFSGRGSAILGPVIPVCLLAALGLLGACQTPAPAPATAELHVVLRDRASGESREGRIQLWRIGVPAEPGWTAGDERVGEYRVVAAGLAIPGLVPGRYRATCDIHARSRADLPEFAVSAPRTEVALQVEPPREREVWVEIFDARGQAFETAEFKPGSRRGSLRQPEWLHLRRQVEADGSEITPGRAGGYTSSSSAHQNWRKLTRGAHGFSLGLESEDGEFWETSRAITLRVPDHGTVGGSVRFDSPEEQRYRVLLVEKGSLEGLFTLPDGGELDLGRLHIQTPLEPEVLPRPAEWWLDVPVRIAVQSPGCRRLELEFRLREGLPRPRTLEKSP